MLKYKVKINSMLNFDYIKVKFIKIINSMLILTNSMLILTWNLLKLTWNLSII